MATGNRGRESKSDKKSAPQRPPKETPASEPMLPETPVNFATLQEFPPAYDNNLRLRQRSVLRLQRKHGNTQVRRMLENPPTRTMSTLTPGNAAANVIQRKKKKGGGKSNGEGPGKVKGAKETFYDVSGEKLSDITDQLESIDGYASETYVGLTIEGKLFPKKKKGKFQVKVKWKTVDHETTLPRWTDYKDACSAAQKEWNRFMKQTRKHEETAHVKMSNKWVKNLGKEDTVITGEDVDDLISNVEAKQIELGERLQEKQDDCGHGVDIDALLHPEKGECSE